MTYLYGDHLFKIHSNLLYVKKKHSFCLLGGVFWSMYVLLHAHGRYLSCICMQRLEKDTGFHLLSFSTLFFMTGCPTNLKFSVLARLAG